MLSVGSSIERDRDHGRDRARGGEDDRMNGREYELHKERDQSLALPSTPLSAEPRCEPLGKPTAPSGDDAQRLKSKDRNELVW